MYLKAQAARKLFNGSRIPEPHNQKGNHHMGKLKQAMIEAQEKWDVDMADMTMDTIIKEDIFFRYGVDIDTAQRVMSLMRLSPPPEALYVHNPDVHEIWLKEFLDDTDLNFQRQLDLFEGRHYG